jgi:hypothetical protein
VSYANHRNDESCQQHNTHRNAGHHRPRAYTLLCFACVCHRLEACRCQAGRWCLALRRTTRSLPGARTQLEDARTMFVPTALVIKALPLARRNASFQRKRGARARLPRHYPFRRHAESTARGTRSPP